MASVVYPLNDNKGLAPAAPPMDPNQPWTTGLFDCFHHCIPNCLMAWCCPCVSLAQVQARIGMTGYSIARLWLGLLFVIMGAAGRIAMNPPTEEGQDAYGDPVYDSVANPLVVAVAYLIWLLAELIFVVAIVVTRRRVRNRFKIAGSCCADMVVSLCCSCCAISQMATHVKSYKAGSCSFGGPDVLPPFTA